MLHKLTAIAVKSAGPGKFNDGHGLWLVKRSDGGEQWVLRVTVFGKRREMGLGSITTCGCGVTKIAENRTNVGTAKKLGMFVLK